MIRWPSSFAADRGIPATVRPASAGSTSAAAVATSAGAGSKKAQAPWTGLGKRERSRHGRSRSSKRQTYRGCCADRISEQRSTLLAMAAASDPFKVLGVSPRASDEELHAAYRRLVQLHHPDHNDGSHESARRFDEVQEAYARIRKLRAQAPADEPPPATDTDLDARLAHLERQVRDAHAARERARRSAAEAAANQPRRPSDEELGYVRTDDSFAKILADAEAELSDRLVDARQHPVGRRVSHLIDELAGKLKNEGSRGSQG